ncbi:hypothetical protein [Prevotella sp.]|uniref:hypothetical protein n=1 Tax=Prevotella sp. TaxID=59823 RepID=UPI003FD87F07
MKQYLSLLERIITEGYAESSTTWQNKATGIITNDEEDETIFRFYECTDDDIDCMSASSTDEDMEQYPVVACGIVGKWIHLREEDDISDIFDVYYDDCMDEYKFDHGGDPDAWDRDLEQEFILTKHIQKEKENIKQSEEIMPYLTEADCKKIRDVADNYLRYARRRRNEALTKKYPRDMVLQKTFADLYLRGGAHTCLQWFRNEYDLPIRAEWGKPHTPMKETLHREMFTNHQLEASTIAKEAFEDFDEDLLLSNEQPLMQEIESNLRKRSSEADRERYLLSLLAPFRDFANAFCPKSRIQDAEREIRHIGDERTRWTAVLDKTADASSKEYADAKEQLHACDEAEQLLRSGIDHYNNVADRLYWYAQHGLTRSCTEEEDSEMCLNLGYWLDILQMFARKLASLALFYGFDLKELQEKSGVYLLPKVMIVDYVDYSHITSFEQARRLLEEIHNRHAADALPDPTPAKRISRQRPTDAKTTKPVPLHTMNYTHRGRDRNKRLQAAMVLLENEKMIKVSRSDDFFDLFSGEKRKCNVSWTGSAVTLTFMLKSLLESAFVEKQRGCSVSSLCTGQFGTQPNSHYSKMTDDDRNVISLVMSLLDPDRELPKRGYEEEED